MKRLDEQAEEFEKQALIAQSARARWRHLAAITNSSVWPQFKAELIARREKLRDQRDSLTTVDPFLLGQMKGKIDFLKELIHFDEFIEAEVSKLAQKEKVSKEQARRRAAFQLRPQQAGL